MKDRSYNITIRSSFFKLIDLILTMSRYWNKILIDKLFENSKERKPSVKYKINTNIGRFYFYFKREGNSKVSGKLVFFPDINSTNTERK